MSLRLRLLTAVTLILLAALGVGAASVAWRADASVQVEMRAALAGAEDAAHEALARQGESSDASFVTSLVRSFDGQRHVRAMALSPLTHRWLQSRLASSADPAPAWFRALIEVRPQTARIPIPLAQAGAVLVLQTDPTNETDEVWRQASDAFGVMLLFCGGTFVAIYAIVGHAMRRFSVFDAALAEVSNGRYDTTIAERGPPEFVALARGFNRMAARVRDFQRRDGELRGQLLTLQEEERAEVARDLHDEVGPYLFAINVDADDIPRLLAQDQKAEVAERAGAIRESAAHIQKHVKAILRQLRPIDALELGLSAAIGDLVAFWARRSPATRFEVDIDEGAAPIDRRTQGVAYRIVQESISNAVRHGQPSLVTIAITSPAGGGLCVTVTDDGAGLGRGPRRAGVGLAGMAERVQALNGQFEIGAAPDGPGVRTTALLPPQDVSRPAELVA